jgi:putative FmdB family regulatory protein
MGENHHLREEPAMPFYDLHCPACNKDFNISASIADKTDRRIRCPECGAGDMETIYKPVSVHVKREEGASCPKRHVCGAGCPHAH